MKRGDTIPMFDPARGIVKVTFLERRGNEMIVRDATGTYRVEIPKRYVEVEFSDVCNAMQA